MSIRLNATADINTHLEMAQNAGSGVINPETFYTKQLLDTIRYDADQYVYFRLAETQPIQEKSDKIQIRRWAPLEAHTVPLVEGNPPKSDKGSVEKYEIDAYQYGRYMEFTDKVDFKVVDPVVAHYTQEYSLVAMETLDMLAREALFAVAQKWYAGGASEFEDLDTDSIPSLTDLRLIILSLKKSLVKPRKNGRYHVIGSPEFYYDMITDPVVASYMFLNMSTKTMYDDSTLVPLFEMEFYETMVVPTSSEYIKNGKVHKRMYRDDGAGNYEFNEIAVDEQVGGEDIVTKVDGYVQDSRTGDDASYIPEQMIWDIDTWNGSSPGGHDDWVEFNAQHVLVLGKDALTRTGLSGEDKVKVYTKPKGSAGVLDPIDQRQSIGFKINSVGFGSTRLEAIVDYVCVPTQVNQI